MLEKPLLGNLESLMSHIIKQKKKKRDERKTPSSILSVCYQISNAVLMILFTSYLQGTLSSWIILSR